MPNLTIKDFRGGLDARKYLLSQPAGVLALADNAHINQGAELEKRKAFTLLANSNGGVSTSLPAGTFGWQATATGHLVFGSADGSALTFPTGVTYQRLQHPQELAGYAAVAMTAVVYSEIYGGKAFVGAKFSDGKTFCYYDGALVSDFTSGLIMSYLATQDVRIAKALTDLVNATTGYTATQVAATGRLNVFGLPGNLYTTAIAKSSTHGTLAAQLLNNGLATVAGNQAVGQFQIVTGTAGVANYIASVKVNNVEMLKNSTAIYFTTDEATTASLIANSISSNAGTTGFYSVASGPLVSILPLAVGTSTNGYVVKVQAAGNVCIGNCAFQIGGDSTVGMTSILSSAILATTTLRQRTGGNLATLTIGTHTFIVGEVVTVSGISGTTAGDYNGTKTITGVVANVSISYASVAANEASIADTGGTVVYTTGSNIMGGAVAGTSNGLNALATAIVTAINANSGTTGFLANAISTKIFISKGTTASNDPALNLVVTPAGAGLTVISAVSATTLVGLTAYTLNATPTIDSRTRKITAMTIGSASVVLGGVLNPPYTYLWTNVSSVDPAGLISIASNTSVTGVFNLAAGITSSNNNYVIKSTWKCTVRDFAGGTHDTPTLDVIVAITIN